MTKLAQRITLMALLLASVTGCQPLSTARYTGPLSPLAAAPSLVSAGMPGGPAIVRGQNGNDSRDLWSGYQRGQGTQPSQNPPSNGQAWPATNRSTAGAPAAGTAPAQVPAGTAYSNTPSVRGSIPIHGNTQPMNFTPQSAVNYQSPQFGQPLPPPSDLLGPQAGDYPYADVDVIVEETETGRFMFGVGVNSDAGMTGQIVIDERNFDLFRPPQRFGDFLDGTAFRGAGQGLRIEAVPGDLVQRYVVNFTEPYLFKKNVSFNTSAFLFDRRFEDWDEQRVGGRVGLGYRLTPDLSVAGSVRAEKVDIHDPRLGPAGYPQLAAALGKHDMYGGGVSLTYDTRDVPFNPTEGAMLEMSFEQTFGSFAYPKFEVDLRRYFLVAERPDGSGRHVLAFQLKSGITGPDTPIFENFYAGGFSTLRGFDFRGASPKEGGINGVTVGGEFMLLGTVEYRFPLTADDMLHGVAFVDYGTVEESVTLNPDNYRVAPGFGLRIAIPAMGPAPIALDFAFPIASAVNDTEETFSFFVGFGR